VVIARGPRVWWRARRWLAGGKVYPGSTRGVPGWRRVGRDRRGRTEAVTRRRGGGGGSGGVLAWEAAPAAGGGLGVLWPVTEATGSRFKGGRWGRNGGGSSERDRRVEEAGESKGGPGVAWGSAAVGRRLHVVARKNPFPSKEDQKFEFHSKGEFGLIL
jgi:hypothetical protein